VRRLATIVAVPVCAALLVVFGSGAGGDEGTYEVRAIFDNGGFLVPGEEVRVAGAKVGSISEVEVTGATEAAHEDGSPEPGKAVVVLRIDEPAFQDFREDASCFIRPQSLLGERFVECRLTEPRASGTKPPPALETVAEGEPGEGQYLLPLERNGKAVDLDLVNQIMREPYPDRFRLILNDLGAALAARGEDLEAVIERSNPALRRTDEVLKILAKQNDDLEQLAKNGDQVLQPLAAKRDAIGGFINNAATTAAATAERRADLEAQFQKLPGFLTELRLTMDELDDFATSSTPVLSDLSDAAPDLTRINTALGPFSDAGTRSFRSLGNAAEASGPDLVASQPVLRDVAELAQDTGPVAKTLGRLLSDLRTSGGYKNLTEVIYNTSGALNAFDSYGHFLRTLLPPNNCVDYVVVQDSLACESNFNRTFAKAAPSVLEDRGGLERNAGNEAPEAQADAPGGIDLPLLPPLGQTPPEEEPPTEEPPAEGESEAAPEAGPSKRSTELLFDYLMGPAPAGLTRGGR
jgi:phospholipid/cholesterol/gamma-HCH transport system substrate-binding protein